MWCVNHSNPVRSVERDREHVRLSVHELSQFEVQRIFVRLLLVHIHSLDQVPPMRCYILQDVGQQPAARRQLLTIAIPGEPVKLEFVCAGMVLLALDLSLFTVECLSNGVDQLWSGGIQAYLVTVVQCDDTDTSCLHVKSSESRVRTGEFGHLCKDMSVFINPS